MTNILITGAGRGIGLELSRQALEKGWTVYGSVRHGAGAKASSIHEHGNFHPLEFDVTDSAAIKKAAASLEVPIDIVINNAGVIGPSRQSTLDMDFDGFALTLSVNTLAPLKVAQAFLPHLLRSDNPRLVTISSMIGSLSSQASDRIAYRASKAAVNKVTQGLATDLSGKVSVIAMHPGWVRTDMGGSSADISPEESASGILTVAEHLTPDQSGTFINHDGRVLDW